MSKGGAKFLVCLIVILGLCGIVAGAVLVLDKVGYLDSFNQTETSQSSGVQKNLDEYELQCTVCGKIVKPNEQCMHDALIQKDCSPEQRCHICLGTGLGEYEANDSHLETYCISCEGTGYHKHDWQYVRENDNIVWTCKICNNSYVVNLESHEVVSGDRDVPCSKCEVCGGTGKYCIHLIKGAFTKCDYCDGKGYYYLSHSWYRVERFKEQGIDVYKCRYCEVEVDVPAGQSPSHDSSCQKNVTLCGKCNAQGYKYVGNLDKYCEKCKGAGRVGDGIVSCQVCGEIYPKCDCREYKWVEGTKLCDVCNGTGNEIEHQNTSEYYDYCEICGGDGIVEKKHDWDLVDTYEDTDGVWLCLYCDYCDEYIEIKDGEDLPDDYCPRNNEVCKNCNGLGVLYVGDDEPFYHACVGCGGTGRKVCSICQGYGYTIEKVQKNYATRKLYKNKNDENI